jgi:hypothetical protein
MEGCKYVVVMPLLGLAFPSAPVVSGMRLDWLLLVQMGELSWGVLTFLTL